MLTGFGAISQCALLGVLRDRLPVLGNPAGGCTMRILAERKPPSAMDIQRLRPVLPAVLDQQHPVPLAQRRDDPADQPEHRGLVGGAMPYHQRPGALRQPLHHLSQRRAEQYGLLLDQVRVDGPHGI